MAGARRLQRIVPVGVVHIGGAYLHPVLLRVAHNLRRRVEAHRLRVEQGGGKHLRMVAFDPGGDIDQQGKRGGVAFRKTVFAKALDLVKTARGKLRRIAAPHHALHHLLLVIADRADPAEGRHRPAQSIGLVGGELCRIDGDLHGLLLKERHTQRAVEDASQLVSRTMLRGRRGVGDGLDAFAAAQVWVDHIALYGAGADNGDLYDEIVEALRL